MLTRLAALAFALALVLAIVPPNLPSADSGDIPNIGDFRVDQGPVGFGPAAPVLKPRAVVVLDDSASDTPEPLPRAIDHARSLSTIEPLSFAPSHSPPRS